MRQLEIENGSFPPKSNEEAVKASPCIPPKAIKSVENARDSVKFTVRKRSSSHFPPKKKLARQLVFTEFGLSPISSGSPPFPVVAPSSELALSPGSPLTCKSESPIPLQRTKTNNGTPKGPKQCGCKQSKCLKLYCECFASGAYCNGCNCTECCNIVGNEDLRKAAAEIILERNPHAFKPKIASTPCSPQNGDEENVPPVGRNERGCHCKKSKCRKRYCECFQANVFCSVNCKCVGCKNFEARKDNMAASGEKDSKYKICKKSELGCEGRIATSPRDNGNRKFGGSLKVSEGLVAVAGEDCIDTKIHIQRGTTAATSNATGLSGQCLSQESRKRKHLELHSDEKDSLTESFSDRQKVNNLKNACPSASFLVETASHNINSAMVGSFRHPYRLMVANVYRLQDTREVCSGLAVLAEAAASAQSAKLFTVLDNNDKADMKDEGANNSGDTLGDKDNDCQEAPAHVQRRASDNRGSGVTDEQVGRILHPATAQSICSEKHEQFIEPASPHQNLDYNIKNAYAEQEKYVLTSFRDFLEKLIAFTSIKDEASSCYGDKPVLLF